MIEALRTLASLIDSIDVTILGSAATGTSTVATDPEGLMLGVVPNSANNPDQHLKKASIGSSGLVTLTIAGNSTSEVKYKVTVLRKTPRQ